MTDEGDKRGGAKEPSARNTARDVPFVRDAGSDAEPAPRGQRPAQLPRDPTYEAELAQVGLAVLKGRERPVDPSTKPGGRRGHELAAGHPPESITPESPQAHGSDRGQVRSPEPPSSSGRSVASGTLLSVGAVDPRGKTERSLETPRMFFSEAELSRQAYFKPGKIPSVTVHPTLETETVKLSDSIDPRRAQTIPRLDRAALARLAEPPSTPESEAPFSRPDDSLDLPASDASPRWNQAEYEPASSLPEHAGQIHASLSGFRDQLESSFRMDGVPTRPEPLAARRAAEPPESLPGPDASTVPTQRDLPMHRIEASRPPPAPAGPALESSPLSSGGRSESEGPRPMTASITGEEPQARPMWVNLAAFAAAVLVAIVLGWLVTGRSPAKQATPAPTRGLQLEAKPLEAPAPQAPAPAAPPPPPAKLAPTAVAPAVAPATPKLRAATPQKSPASSPAPATPAAAPRKSASPKSSHETIF